MLKKATKIILVMLFLVSSVPVAFADGQPPAPGNKSGNFSKKTFSNKNAWSNNGKASSPPNPGGPGSGGGTPLPISGGLAFLLIGSAGYILKRIKDEKIV